MKIDDTVYRIVNCVYIDTYNFAEKARETLGMWEATHNWFLDELGRWMGPVGADIMAELDKEGVERSVALDWDIVEAIRLHIGKEVTLLDGVDVRARARW